jgi:hypothetical protein
MTAPPPVSRTANDSGRSDASEYWKATPTKPNHEGPRLDRPDRFPLASSLQKSAGIAERSGNKA